MQPFNIYIDRLKGGFNEKIEFDAGPEFLDIKEEELAFPDKVSIKGDTYLAEDHLLIHLRIHTLAVLPCSICNEPTPVPLEINDFYHAEPIEELKSGVFDFTEVLRESILLQVPPFAECNQGRCPKRESVSKFFKKPEGSSFPFSDLDKN